MAQSFYARDALEVALELVGKRLVHGDIQLLITETEAYRHLPPPGDSANHCRAGRTDRNAPMWGPPGRAYVYLCYGIHQMLNLVTGREGEGAAVLIRACELAPAIAGSGRELVRRRRGGRPIAPDLLNGPGKVGQALGLDGSFNGHPLFKAGGLELHHGLDAPDVVVGPRVGIDYAAEADREALWRFARADSRWVSHRKTLRPRQDPDGLRLA